MRQDGTGFKNEGDCVSYAAHGGKLLSCAGSENFSEFPEFSTPSTFSGGTIDTAYGVTGGVLVQGSFFNGGFPDGTHVLFSGFVRSSFQLSFANPTGFLQLEGQDNVDLDPSTITLTAYDASSTVIGMDQFVDSGPDVAALSVQSSSNNIKYFTVSTSDPRPNPEGVFFTNIAWRCA